MFLAPTLFEIGGANSCIHRDFILRMPGKQANRMRILAARCCAIADNYSGAYAGKNYRLSLTGDAVTTLLSSRCHSWGLLQHLGE